MEKDGLFETESPGRALAVIALPTVATEISPFQLAIVRHLVLIAPPTKPCQKYLT